ncbi:nuclear transport factor 2 family protein [uncultured Imperialibacter sp.]|uniref:nuclear transport factor 2 family protein n=1 Tax=uncultured Imperialibacter sp. TaxID=1672639 RepID=UPI0030DA3015|tara:strand:+ start:39511 stop:40089 length:579 start_codon:yes stop_codon:yes gene_type:complete
MKNRLPIALVIFVLSISCTQKQSFDGFAATKAYFEALNESDYDEVTSLFLDSIRMREGIYTSVFSKQAYKHMFQWDSTFHPTYEIREIEQSGDTVLMQVSKTCTRIHFLHEEPTVTKERVVFQNGKILSIEIVDFVVFNDERWATNRAHLVSFVEENHPELNGFLHDQTKAGAIKYLKAIELYQSQVTPPEK